MPLTDLQKATVKQHIHTPDALIDPDTGEPADLGGDPEAVVDAAIDAHEAAANPHPTYETSAEAQAKVDAAVTALKNGVGAGGDTLFELDARIAIVEALGSLATDAELVAAVAALVNSATGAADTLGELEALNALRMLKSANLSDVANAATARDNLGVEIGVDVQAFDADIPTVAASQAEMEAGTETALRSVSPLRVAQGFDQKPWVASADPTANDDSGDGHRVGRTWFNTASGAAFWAEDVSSGAAVWNPFSSGGGGSDYIATLAAEANLLRYWPINEPIGSSSFHEELGGTALTGTVACGQVILNGDLNGGAAGMAHAAWRLSNASPFTWPAAWTMECWAFFLNNFAGGAIFGQWDGTGAGVFSNGAGDVRAYCGGSFDGWGGSTNDDITGRHHILLAHDGTNIKLFWDGVQKVTAARTKPTGTQGSNPILGGWNGGGSGGPFVLSDYAVYSDYDAGRAAAHYALGNL